MNTGLTKKQIRSRMFLRLREQKEEDRNRKSRIIEEKLLESAEFIRAKTVMFYISFDGEVNTEDMIKEAQNLGKIVAVPVCNQGGTMRPAILDKKPTLKKGPYGIYEPAVKRCISLEDLNLVIVPGVAFDKKGNRLGRGKGFYDRFLKQLSRKTTTIGLAFAFQILPSLPTSSPDVSIDKLIFA